MRSRIARFERTATLTPTNQVPATWFESDAGIRRLASRWSDGPSRGRRRRFGCVWSFPVSDEPLLAQTFRPPHLCAGRAQRPLHLVQRGEEVVPGGAAV